MIGSMGIASIIVLSLLYGSFYYSTYFAKARPPVQEVETNAKKLIVVDKNGEIDLPVLEPLASLRPGREVAIASETMTQAAEYHLEGADTPTADNPKIEDMSREELAQRYRTADGNVRAAVTEELKRRDQRVTKVVGELFPNMQLNREYNVFVVVQRGRKHETAETVPDPADTNAKQTIEPKAITVTTSTWSEVGARLLGANFEIHSDDADERGIDWKTIPDGEKKTFTWVVKPEAEGTLQLTVDLLTRVDFDTETLILEVDKFPKTVTVTVDFWTYVGRFAVGVNTAAETTENVGKAISALFGVTGIGGLWYLFYGRKRPRRDGGQSRHHDAEDGDPPQGEA
ncbi:hypothetical protein GR183_06485 [Stappia sp. GBMRC 2046]|uniref:Uncharacterized protein n=1 Tax=Stappia sediminis TaxID=2692190 RepID=A0A7X3S792_9HYPH|nr:hypothetical protein [Stappia sediminis]MXN64546.1 hypothetical protein [Stappia sediminis]